MRNSCKPVWLAVVAPVIIFASTFTSALANPLSGTLAIGPSGEYPSITAAIADIQTQTLGGPLVLELQPNYVSSVETYPIVFHNLTTTAANTLTLRPQIGATNLVITSAVTTSSGATVELFAAQFVTIDGRPGGMGSNAGSGGGTASQLTIANTSTSGAALRFFRGAGGNTITYTTLRGMNNVTIGGVVIFSFGTNSDNTIDHCDVGDSAKTPANCIFSSLTAPNSNNIVANCNIFNFFSGTDQYGIRLEDSATSWKIIGNSFYQTSQRAIPSGGAPIGAIHIATSGDNFLISSNFVGGSAPGAAGSAWTITGTPNAVTFTGISLQVGPAVPSVVQGNTVRNFYWNTTHNASSPPGIWGGIIVPGGSATMSDNVVRDATIITSGNGSLSTGISSTSGEIVVIANNLVTSLSVSGTTAAASPSLTGITVTGGTNTITNNIVGSLSDANALYASTSSTGNSQMVTGISSSSSIGASIIGNVVGGLNNLYSGTAGGCVRGILVTNGVNAVTGNTVVGLNTTTKYSGSQSLASALGISISSGLPGQTISQNIVDSIGNSAASGTVFVSGIDFSGPPSGPNVIAQNLVRTLQMNSSTTSSQVSGFSFNSGTFTAENNMACVGMRASGGSTAGASLVYGINDNGSDAGRNFFHNSVYLGGARSSMGAPYSAALFSNGSGNARTFQNNIFVNARSRTGTTGTNYAIYHAGADLTGLVSDGNILRASGTGGALINWNSTTYNTLADWQSATGQDPASLVADPLFVNPTGGSTADLHISSSSPAINAGLPLGVPTDFDGDPRSATAPAIGADEFSYRQVPGYNLLSAQWLGDSTNVIGFQGLPGSGYALEMATNLTPPVFWQPLETNNAGPDGSLVFTNVTLQSRVFYRTRLVP